MAHLGHPLVGDRVYGSGSEGGLQLVAYQLMFRCPSTGKEQTFTLTEPVLTPPVVPQA